MLKLADRIEYCGKTLSLYKEGEIYHYKVETADGKAEVHLIEFFEENYEALLWFWEETTKYIEEHLP